MYSDALSLGFKMLMGTSNNISWTDSDDEIGNWRAFQGTINATAWRIGPPWTRICLWVKTPGAAFRTWGCLFFHRRQGLQLSQAPHVVGQVLETHSPPRSHNPDTANQGPTHVVALCAKDMLDPCPNARPTSVDCFLPIIQRAIVGSLAVYPARQARGLDTGFNVFRPVDAVGPHAACRVVRRKQFIQHLAVMHRRVRHPVAPYQFVSTIDAGVILVAIVALAVLLRPARLRVLLATLGRLVIPGLGRLATLDLLVFVAAVALNRNRNNRRINDLAAPGSVPLAFEIGVEILE